MNDKTLRKRLRFSLRAVLVGVSLLSIVLALGVWWRDRTLAQAHAVARLRGLGAHVSYAYGMERTQVVTGRQVDFVWCLGETTPELPGAARWLTPLLGPDAFFSAHTVVIDQQRPGWNREGQVLDDPSFAKLVEALHKLPGIRQIAWYHAADFDAAKLGLLPCWNRLESLLIVGRGFKDSDMEAIGEARNLRTLELGEDRHLITDAGFAHLRHLTRLEQLSLRLTRMQPGVLRHLSPLRQLRKLDLGWSGAADDQSLKYLAPLKELESLRLQKSSIRGPGLADLGEKPKLKWLALDFSPIDDNGLAFVSRFTSLRELGLYDTQIEGPGFVHLKDLTNLEELYLAHNRIADSGLRYVPRLTTLKELDISDTQITDAAVNPKLLPANLERMDLAGTGVTDAVVDQLILFPNLNWVSLKETKVSADAVKRLEAAKPACIILTE